MLNNTASLSCANSATSKSQDSKCDKTSKANTTVREDCLRVFTCRSDVRCCGLA
jgi:hypothetical protein